jgi:PAS domain-containing protein
VILRVLTAHTSAPAAVAARIGTETMSAAYRARGLLSFQAGFRPSPDGATFTLITTWTDYDSLVEAIGTRPDRPRWLGDASYDDSRAEHYELVGVPLTGIVPLDGAVVRVLRGRLRADGASTYFEFMREQRLPFFESGETILAHLGRRIVGRHQEAIVVSVWRDAAAIARHGGADDRPVASLEVDRFFESWTLETFLGSRDGVTDGRPACPALILMDDTRRYRYATPAAATLHGIPLADLLGQRVDDVVPPEKRTVIPAAWDEFKRVGSYVGEGAVPRSDGPGPIVGFRARADFPWLGANSVVFAPAPPDEVPEIDAALAACAIS